jgi:hypothetical protein
LCARETVTIADSHSLFSVLYFKAAVELQADLLDFLEANYSLH